MGGRTRLLQVGILPDELHRALADYDLIALADLKGRADGFEIAVTTSMTGMDAEQMAQAPDLRMIACNGAGLERIDIEQARRRGIFVANTPDAVTRDTADFAIALIYAVSRRLVEGDRFVRAGRWPGERFAPSRRVFGQRVGVVGLGRIGSAIAERAAASGLRVAYHARAARPEAPYPYAPSVPDLAEMSDYLVMACPGGEATRHLANAEVLERLGPAGYLINVSRGSVVDEGALLAALRAGSVAGAALDVFEGEPDIDPAFFALDNVILTPHIAAITHEARADIAEQLRADIAAFLAKRAD